MANFSIGLSGLDAAKRALDVIGNNIANAATHLENTVPNAHSTHQTSLCATC